MPEEKEEQVNQVEAVPAAQELPIPKPLLFGTYSFDSLTITDRGLKRYLNLNPVIVPHSEGRFANRKFGKSKMNIVERLINALMRTGRFTGKKSKGYRVVKEAFAIIAEKTKSNPIQIFIDAIQRASPREEATRLIYGGVSVPKAVDVAPARRIDIAIRNIAKGAIAASHKNKRSIQDCLAQEIMLAAKGDVNSFAIAKKDEVERIAVSAR